MTSIEVNLADIDAIIFDLGGVIINICYDKTIEALGQLVGKKRHQLYPLVASSSVFDRYEMGRISSNEFRAELRQLLKLPDVSDVILDEAWNAMLLDIPSNRIGQLKALCSSKRLFVLSNTNEIHMAAFGMLFSEASKILTSNVNTLNDVVEQVYCSHLMGDRKPHSNVFKTILAEQDLVPSKTLFIDDTLKHVESARLVGLQGIHLDQKQGLSFEDIAWNAGTEITQ